jgi:hypothetical protein
MHLSKFKSNNRFTGLYSKHHTHTITNCMEALQRNMYISQHHSHASCQKLRNFRESTQWNFKRTLEIEKQH